MTVKQLIESLQQIDPGVLVCGYADDESLCNLTSIGKLQIPSKYCSEPFGVKKDQQFIQLYFGS